MAKFLFIEKKEYDQFGTVPLKRGDKWDLDLKIFDNLGRERIPVDLTDMGVTGFFPPATGTTPIAVTGSITSPFEGAFNLTLPGSTTQNVAVADQGTSFYVKLAAIGDTEVETIETKDEPLQILSPNFRVF